MNELATTVLWLTSLVLPGLIFFAGGISQSILAAVVRAILAIGFGWLFIVAYAQAAQFLSQQPINGAALAFASVLGWILPSAIVGACLFIRWIIVRRHGYKRAEGAAGQLATAPESK